MALHMGNAASRLLEVEPVDAIERVKKTLVELDIEGIQTAVREALDGGNAPLDIALRGLGEGMKDIGELFQSEEYYLADLVLAGETMKEGMAVLEPLISGDGASRKGPVVLFTVKGDVHDIGKNLVVTMLSAAGFKVVDLGVDVAETRVVDALRESGASLLGMSVLITPMISSIGDVVDAIKEAGLRERVRIAVGGACTTPELVEKFGLDALGRDAVEAVGIFEEWETKKA
ncbi:MAG: cobalamin-dependent protein [Actinomycetota bacterium]|nr:cobalamin-dependent protein [Actinomycetota bacterium]